MEAFLGEAEIIEPENYWPADCMRNYSRRKEDTSTHEVTEPASRSGQLAGGERARAARDREALLVRRAGDPRAPRVLGPHVSVATPAPVPASASADKQAAVGDPEALRPAGDAAEREIAREAAACAVGAGQV